MVAPWPPEILQLDAFKRIDSAVGTALFVGPRMKMGLDSGEPLVKPDLIACRVEYRGSLLDRVEALLTVARRGEVC